jgi:hypothetical protein
MKAKKSPAGAKWEQWPTLEQLHEHHPELKLYQLRERLVEVPCYRCADNSVRYPTEKAHAALNGAGDGDDAGDELDGIDARDVPEPKQFNTLMLLRECLRMLTDAREEKNRTITLMETPLKIGVQLMQDAVAVTAKRLDALENQWDKLIRTTEELVSMHAERDNSAKKQEAAIALRGKAGDAFFSQWPKMVATWGLNQQASMALDLIASFEPEIVDAFMQSGTLNPTQLSALTQLRAFLAAKKQAPNEQAAEQNHNHTPS